MAVAYCLYHANDGYKTVAVEQPLELPLYDLVTGEPIPGSTYNGIVDWICEKDGQLYFADHKTASKADHSYWENLRGDAQITTYYMAARQMGIPIQGFLWDVILKPTISPKKIPKKDKDLLAETGMYCGEPYTDTDWRTAEKETPKMYGIRVRQEYLKDPKRFFLRRIINRSNEEIFDYLQDLKLIDAAMSRTDTEEKALKNRTHCKAFNSMCDYHNMCFGDKTGYQDKEPRDSPFSSESRSVSSVNCFLNCRRKWYYQKVAKIEPVKQEYRDALAIGTMFHHALELFLLSRPSDMTVEFQGNLCDSNRNTHNAGRSE